MTLGTQRWDDIDKKQESEKYPEEEAEGDDGFNRASRAVSMAVIRTSDGNGKTNGPGKPKYGGQGEKANRNQLMEESGHVSGHKANINKDK